MRPVVSTEMMSNDELDCLYKWAEVHSPILEVGAYKGWSTVVLASTRGLVHVVDWFKGDEFMGTVDVVHDYFNTLKEFQVDGDVITHVGDKTKILPTLPNKFFNMIFLDANHSYESTMSDLIFSLDLIRPNGIIALHDWGNSNFGVTEAVMDFCDEYGWTVKDCVGALIVIGL